MDYCILNYWYTYTNKKPGSNQAFFMEKFLQYIYIYKKLLTK
jgi:hypothetical protein